MASGSHSHSPTHHHLHVPGASVVHRLAPEAKVAALVVFVAAVALTPRRAVPVFGVDAIVVASVVAAARLPVLVVARRLVVIVPFLVAGALVPFVAGGRHVDVAGVSLSVEGLWATWNVAAKATLGAAASIVVSATTPVPDLLRGLARLRVPAVLVAIVAFLFRYLDLLADQLVRMRTAMAARGHDPRWLWQARPVAAAAGAMFVRTYERGERIHHAMASRGFDGTMPDVAGTEPDRPHRWVAASAPAAAVVALATWWAW